MKNLIQSILFILVMIGGAPTQSQPVSVFPDQHDNQTWEYATLDYWSGYCWKNLINIGDSVTVGNKPMIEVIKCNIEGENCGVIGYYRIIGDSVMVRSASGGVERLMYDFSLMVGDTVTCGWFNNSTTNKLWPKDYGGGYAGSTMQYNIPGLFPGYFPEEMYWTKGIGSSVHPFYPLTCIGDNCEQYQQVTKVTRNGAVIYSAQFQYYCYGWTSIGNTLLNVSADPKIAVYSNPFFDNLRIGIDIPNSNSQRTMEVFNLFGEQIAFDDSGDEEIIFDLQKFPAGMYQVIFNFADSQVVRKVIKSGYFK